MKELKQSSSKNIGMYLPKGKCWLDYVDQILKHAIEKAESNISSLLLRWAKYFKFYELKEEDVLHKLVRHFPDEYMYLAAAATRQQ